MHTHRIFAVSGMRSSTAGVALIYTNIVMIWRKWTHWDLNPGPSACEADVIPLHHVPNTKLHPQNYVAVFLRMSIHSAHQANGHQQGSASTIRNLQTGAASSPPLTTPPAGLEPAIFGLEVRRLVH